MPLNAKNSAMKCQKAFYSTFLSESMMGGQRWSNSKAFLKRCYYTGSMRKIKTFLNIKALRHVTVEVQNTNINLKMNIIQYGFFKNTDYMP